MKKKIMACFLLYAFFSHAHQAEAISISPPVIDVAADPGATIERSITVENETDKERTYSVGVMNFGMTGEEGYQKFIPTETESSLDLSGWIKYGEDRITVQPKSAKKFIFTIEVPLNADPGGHYASVYFSTGTTKSEENRDSGVGVQAQINSLILLQISGDVNEKALIEGFDLENKNSLLYHLPAKFILRVNNQGNVHIRPKGNIEIKNIFGKRTVLLDANPKNNRVLPQNIRRIESQWGEGANFPSENIIGNFIEETKYDFRNFALGKYAARLDIVYGKGNGNLLSKEITFWVIPWRALLVSAFFTAIVLVFGIALIKKYNRWIIKKHNQSLQ